MKGTPAEPECGFSRAVVQILDLHGVPSEKMKTYNVLADQDLRSGIKEFSYVYGFHIICVEFGLTFHDTGNGLQFLRSMLMENLLGVAIF